MGHFNLVPDIYSDARKRCPLGREFGTAPNVQAGYVFLTSDGELVTRWERNTGARLVTSPCTDRTWQR